MFIWFSVCGYSFKQGDGEMVGIFPLLCGAFAGFWEQHFCVATLFNEQQHRAD